MGGGSMGTIRQGGNVLLVTASRMAKRAVCFTAVLFFPLVSTAHAADAPVPVATDSRIKTFVYSENDVFNIVTHYGYQSNIELGNDEVVEAVSLGDPVPFKVVTSGRRLFIRALLASARTNMTVVTNKHAYQFDLLSVPAPATPNEELVYVVRFFYPGDKKNMATQYSDGTVDASKNLPRPMSANKSAYNYKYTFSGSNEIAPLKIFDDGQSTYFKLQPSTGSATPTIYAVDQIGKETAVSTYNNGEYWVVTSLAPRFVIREGDYEVTVYNDKIAN